MSTTHPQPSPLPSPRAFMTSLFNTLTSTPSQSHHAPAPSPSPNPYSSSVTPHRDARPVDAENRLKSVEAEKKALLMTLHVIFPPPLLLQALDLLDRGGVVRVVLREEGEGDDGEDDHGLEEGGTNSGHAHAKGMSVTGARVGHQSLYDETEKPSTDQQGKGTNPGNAPRHNPTSRTAQHRPGHTIPPHDQSHMYNPRPLPPPPPPPSIPTPPPRITLHQVHSPHSTAPKRHATHSHSHSRPAASTPAPSQNPHTVHLSAWNCTCAAFTYSAYPAIPIPIPPPTPPRPRTETRWIYGGGHARTPETPMCKHLLACLLGERWATVLGGCVRERRVGREEMAGLVI
ncbi:hypothetical protein MFRU_001g04430 [Monilinia fructicola]|nr:hypothetical protein MFRU_001g04430 [Monilinia fructicola]